MPLTPRLLPTRAFPQRRRESHAGVLFRTFSAKLVELIDDFLLGLEPMLSEALLVLIGEDPNLHESAVKWFRIQSGEKVFGTNC